MKSVESGTNATFYHYRLLKKVLVPKALVSSFITLPFIWLAAETIFISWTSIFFFLLAFPVALWIQYVVSRSVLIIVSHSYHKRWRFSRQLPWIGYMPDQFVRYSAFRPVYLHTAWIGCCIAAILIPWSPVSFVFALFFWHIWLSMPTLLVMLRFRKQPKDGMLKITGLEISYYMQ